MINRFSLILIIFLVLSVGSNLFVNKKYKAQLMEKNEEIKQLELNGELLRIQLTSNLDLLSKQNDKINSLKIDIESKEKNLNDEIIKIEEKYKKTQKNKEIKYIEVNSKECQDILNKITELEAVFYGK